MNKKLIKKLSDKWSRPGGLPAKGSELVKGEGGLNPCAQSEAVMLSKGMGVMDFEAFLKGSLSSSSNQDLNLDKVTAKTLGISVTHAVLLRRFNDLSSLNPAIVLFEPERILGKNWGKVLEFWHFIDTLSQENCEDLVSRMKNIVLSKEYRERKASLKFLAEGLDVIVPDLYYAIGSVKPLDSSKYERKTEEEMANENPLFEVAHSGNQHQPKVYRNEWPDHDRATVVGDYSRAYFGWIAPYDYFLSNLAGGPELMKLQVLFACATNEIQTLGKGQTYGDLYFCKIIGYNPLKNHTLIKIQRVFNERKQSLLASLDRFYRIADNYLFSRFSKDDNVREAPTKAAVEGLLELTEDDITGGKAYDKIIKTYEIGKGRFFGSLIIRVPKLGSDTKVGEEFYRLTQTLKENFNVQPLSFCEEEGISLKEGSEWAVTSRNERTGPRFNAPKGYNQNATTVSLIHKINHVNNDPKCEIGREGCPIMTLEEVDGSLSLIEVLNFVKRAKEEGANAALLTVPASKTDPNHVLFSKLLSEVLGQVHAEAERLPDSPIRGFNGSSGMAVWRLSW